MQHKFCCVNLIGRSWRTCKNKPNNSHIPYVFTQWRIFDERFQAAGPGIIRIVLPADLTAAGRRRGCKMPNRIDHPSQWTWTRSMPRGVLLALACRHLAWLDRHLAPDGQLQCPGRIVGIIGQDPSVPKSNRSHAVIFLFFFVNVQYIPYIPLKSWVTFLKSSTSTGIFLRLNRFICN